MVQRKGMLGLVRFRMLRAGISKYSTLRLASSSGLWAASRAMPTSAMAYFRLLFAFWQEVQAILLAAAFFGRLFRCFGGPPPPGAPAKSGPQPALANATD